MRMSVGICRRRRRAGSAVAVIAATVSGPGRAYFCSDLRFWCPLLAISNGKLTPASAETPGRSRRRLAAPLVVLLFVISAAGAALLYARHRGASTIGLPLQAVARVALPAPSSRFDYAELDSAAHRLFLAQLGASRLLVIDTDTRRVVSVTGALADVHGVIVVPAVRRVFVTATGSNQLVALDEVTGAEEFRAPTGD